MPMPSEYAKSKYDNANKRTEEPWVFTQDFYENSNGTSYIKVIQPGDSKVEYLSCESHGYIRPIILVSKTQLEKYMKEKEKDEE